MLFVLAEEKYINIVVYFLNYGLDIFSSANQVVQCATLLNTFTFELNLTSYLRQKFTTKSISIPVEN